MEFLSSLSPDDNTSSVISHKSEDLYGTYVYGNTQVLMKFWINDLCDCSQVIELSFHTHRAISASEISSLQSFK